MTQAQHDAATRVAHPHDRTFTRQVVDAAVCAVVVVGRRR